MSSSEVIGLVLRVDAKACVVDLDGRSRTVPLRGRLFEDRGHQTSPVAVGDRVRVRVDGDEGVAIEDVLPRRSQLARRAKGDEAREQVLAANVSLVLIVAAVRDPPLQPILIDRILASCERQSLPVAIAFTKVDRDPRGDSAAFIELYRGLGYDVYPTSTVPGHETVEVLQRLAAVLHSNTTVLTGLSGVGKSTLVNWLIPGVELKIGSMSRIRQGKHTTTRTELIPLPGGGHVLDTPGIRNFALFGVDPHELTFWFREFADFARACAFNDCTHDREPGCGIRAALERGALHPSRYASFRTIFDELAKPTEW